MTYELLAGSFPEEPPVGSVVLNERGEAYQRYSNTDRFGGPWRASQRMMTWVGLLAANPKGVLLVYVGEGGRP